MSLTAPPLQRSIPTGASTSYAAMRSLLPYLPTYAQPYQKLVSLRHTSVCALSEWAQRWRSYSLSLERTPSAWWACGRAAPCSSASISLPSPSPKAWPRAFHNTEHMHSYLPHMWNSIANKCSSAPPGPILRGIRGNGTGLVLIRRSKIAFTPNYGDYNICRSSNIYIRSGFGKALANARFNKRRTPMRARKNVCARLHLQTWPSRIKVRGKLR